MRVGPLVSPDRCLELPVSPAPDLLNSLFSHKSVCLKAGLSVGIDYGRLESSICTDNSPKALNKWLRTVDLGGMRIDCGAFVCAFCAYSWMASRVHCFAP